MAVLIGLVLVSAGVDGGDAWAALFVAVLVLVAAVRLGVGNVHVLMDRAPIGLAGEIERAVRGVQGVREVRAVRVREAGGESFADVTIGVSRLEGLERSHETMDRVEEAVRDRVGPAQVTVHVEPTASRETADRAGGGRCAARPGRGRDPQHQRAGEGPRAGPSRCTRGWARTSRWRRWRRCWPG